MRIALATSLQNSDEDFEYDIYDEDGHHDRPGLDDVENDGGSGDEVNKENADVMESAQLCILLSKDCAAMFVQWEKWKVICVLAKHVLQRMFAKRVCTSFAQKFGENEARKLSGCFLPIHGPKLRSGRTRAEKNRENAVYGHLHWPLLFVITIQMLVMKMH